ncbi:MAG: trigger factor [Muribaculaceae bacterium]|nr:trigger factor [Muribaculaceae bacterium]MDE6794823.1 trigger factor [Muribaculaceae bacterium]
MNVNYDKLDNVNGVITVTIEEKDYADKVKKQLKEIGKKHVEPGFRPGKVPAGLIAKKYGNSVKYDAVNETVGEAVYNYIKENNLHVLGQPVPDTENAIDINNNDFTFKFKVGVAPEIDNHVNKDLHVPYYTIQVTEDMINEQIDGLRKRFGRQVSGEETDDNCVIKGVITELNEDGSVKEGGVVVENGILAPVHFKNDEQKELFKNKKVGDSVVFNPAATCDTNPVEMSSMLNIDKEDVENHKGNFRFDIKDIIVLKPADLDQELFDNAVGKDKAHNEEEFRAAIKELLALNLSNDSNYRFTIDAKDAVEKAVGQLELPVEILKEFLIRQNEALNKDNIDEEFDKLRGQLEWDLVRDNIAEKFEVKVSNEDILDEARGVVVRQLMQYGPGALTDQLVEQYANQVVKDQKNREMLTQNALTRKVFEVIKENVSLDNKDVTVEEFRQLFAPAQAEA